MNLRKFLKKSAIIIPMATLLASSAYATKSTTPYDVKLISGLPYNNLTASLKIKNVREEEWGKPRCDGVRRIRCLYDDEIMTISINNSDSAEFQRFKARIEEQLEGNQFFKFSKKNELKFIIPKDIYKIDKENTPVVEAIKAIIDYKDGDKDLKALFGIGKDDMRIIFENLAKEIWLRYAFAGDVPGKPNDYRIVGGLRCCSGWGDKTTANWSTFLFSRLHSLAGRMRVLYLQQN